VCGIAGMVCLNGSAPSGVVDRMLALMTHRGPDDSGLFEDPTRRFVLGSRRLAIQDLSAAGHMPMSDPAGSVWIVFNGEIYNFQELRRTLAARGHEFRSRTDTEAILFAYLEYGDAFLHELEGMFAIGILDLTVPRLLLARDRIGEKPMYYVGSGGTFTFASEIKAFTAIPAFRARLSNAALWQYLTFGFVMPPLTMFEGVSKMAPGEVLDVRPGESVARRFWRLQSDRESVRRIRAQSETETVADVRRMVEEAVEKRMVADVPVGSFLSSGIDSSIVTATMARLSTAPVYTLTVANRGLPELDESARAVNFARSIGAKPHVVEISEPEVVGMLPEFVYHMDEPLADPACMNTYVASREFRQLGVGVAVVGEGADEAFVGYPVYLRYGRYAPLLKALGKVPPACRGRVKSLLNAALDHLGKKDHQDLIRRAVESETLFTTQDVFFPDGDKQRLLGPAAHALYGLPSAAGVSGRVQADLTEDSETFRDIVETIAYCETRMRLAEMLVMRVDKMSMAHSVEVRAPFLDYRIVDYALSVPTRLRTRSGTKHLLRKAFQDLLPEGAHAGPKVGFSTPIALWFKGRLGDHFADRIGRCSLFQAGVLDLGYARALLDEHRAGRQQRHAQLWNLLVLTEWLEKYQVDVGN